MQPKVQAAAVDADATVGGAPKPADGRPSRSDTMHSTLSLARDLSIFFAALMLYVGYVYFYYYNDYFGLTADEIDLPIQLVPIESLTVLLNNQTLILLCLLAARCSAMTFYDTSSLKHASRSAD